MATYFINFNASYALNQPSYAFTTRFSFNKCTRTFEILQWCLLNKVITNEPSLETFPEILLVIFMLSTVLWKSLMLFCSFLIWLFQHFLLLSLREKMPFHHVTAGLLYKGNFLSRSLSEHSNSEQLASISVEELDGEY